MYRGERLLAKRMDIILKRLGNIGVMVFSLLCRPNYRNYSTSKTLTAGEIRLHSFTTIYAACPDYLSIFSYSRVILEHEEINQVLGSFKIWPNFSPIRIEASGLLPHMMIYPHNILSWTLRKFSRNYEHSLFLSMNITFTTTDLNLLFGTDSYLPRMATELYQLSFLRQGPLNCWKYCLEPKVSRNGFHESSSAKKFSFLNRTMGTTESSEDAGIPWENLLNLILCDLKLMSPDDEEEL
ncbi:hypothetical protein CVS40_12563 [Lucilia cuprina]|nr:hypothetical protein CVS40_12563 [Lucilia cuprina]